MTCRGVRARSAKERPRAIRHAQQTRVERHRGLAGLANLKEHLAEQLVGRLHRIRGAVGWTHALFDRHGFELFRAHRLLVGKEPEEAFDVGAAQLLVRPRQAPELSPERADRRTGPHQILEGFDGCPSGTVLRSPK